MLVVAEPITNSPPAHSRICCRLELVTGRRYMENIVDNVMCEILRTEKGLGRTCSYGSVQVKRVQVEDDEILHENNIDILF